MSDNENKCPICLDRLSTKKTVVLRRCLHEFCLKCLDDLVLNGPDQDPPLIVECPLCKTPHGVWFSIREITHPVINLIHDPIDLTNEVIDLTNE